MICPDCNGTTVRMVPVPWTKGAAWVKASCTCDGGYTTEPINWDLVFASPAPAGAE